MVGGKEAVVTDLYVVKHHCESSRDRDVIRQIMTYIEKSNDNFADYHPIYPECMQDQDQDGFPDSCIGKRVMIISDNCRLPKGTVCEIVQWIAPELDRRNYYIRNVESDYCCWVSDSDIAEITVPIM